MIDPASIWYICISAVIIGLMAAALLFDYLEKKRPKLPAVLQGPFTELRSHLWMTTPHGESRCFAVIDYGPEDDLYWVCIQQEGDFTGQIWTWHNSEVRIMANRTVLRGAPNEANRSRKADDA